MQRFILGHFQLIQHRCGQPRLPPWCRVVHYRLLKCQVYLTKVVLPPPQDLAARAHRTLQRESTFRHTFLVWREKLSVRSYWMPSDFGELLNSMLIPSDVVGTRGKNRPAAVFSTLMARWSCMSSAYLVVMNSMVCDDISYRAALDGKQ